MSACRVFILKTLQQDLKMKISILQLDTFWENPQKNISIIEQKIAQNTGSDIYILPEMLNTGFSNNVANCGERIDGYTITELKKLTQRYNTAICGSLIIHEDNRFYNSFVFIKPDGEIIRYNKRHLFRFGGEAEMFTAGTERIVINYKGFRILPQICYDLRFPVWTRNHNDYDMIIYVANWPESRRFAFDTLLKARAIENQAYVLGVNRIGVDGSGLKYNGGSCILDFKGEYIQNCADNTECVVSANLEIEKLDEFKKKFPAWEDKDSFRLE